MSDLPLAGPIPTPELDTVYRGKTTNRSHKVVVDESNEWPYVEDGTHTSAFQRNETLYRAIKMNGDGTYLMCVSRNKKDAIKQVTTPNREDS